MAIEYVTSYSGNGSSVSISPSVLQAGDLMVGIARRTNSASAPGIPSGWTFHYEYGGNSKSYRVGYKIAESNTDTSGSWSNSGRLTVLIFRGASQLGAYHAANANHPAVFPNLTMQGEGSFVIRGVIVGGAGSAPSIPSYSKVDDSNNNALFVSSGPVGSSTGSHSHNTDVSGNIITTVEVLATPPPPGPIEFVGGASAAANSLSPISGQLAGDVSMVFAVSETSENPPALPSGWTDFPGVDPQFSNALFVSARLGVRVTESDGESLGTWTRANRLVAVTYRNCEPYSGNSWKFVFQTSSLTYSAIDTGVWNSRPRGEVWAVRFGVHDFQLSGPSNKPNIVRAGSAYIGAWDSNGPTSRPLSATSNADGSGWGFSATVLLVSPSSPSNFFQFF